MHQNISNPWDKEYKGSQMNPVYIPLWTILQLFIQKYSIETVIDYGCGDGVYSFLMKKSGCDVIGIDGSARAIEKAMLQNQGCLGERCSFICNSSIPDNLPNESFDAVVMLNSYHCLKSKERLDLLLSINRVLKKNGYLFASVLSLNDESYPRISWDEIEVNTFVDGEGKVFHFFSFEELSIELNEFEVLDNRILQSIHPELKRKSSLIVITAKVKK